MSGIDAIINRITEDARSSADARIKRAEKKAHDIVSRKNEEALLQKQKKLDEAHKQIAHLEAKSRSAASSQLTKRLLLEKGRIIDDVLAHTHQAIIDLPSNDAFQMIEQFVLRNLSKGSDAAKLVLSARDISRVPRDFTRILSEKSGATVTLSDTPGDFDAGCVLICGPIEYNGTVDALIHDMQDALRDKANQILFSDF